MGKFSPAPAAPAALPAPPPPVPEKETDTEVKAKKEETARQARNRVGLCATTNTLQTQTGPSSRGLASVANTQRQTLLGS